MSTTLETRPRRNKADEPAASESPVIAAEPKGGSGPGEGRWRRRPIR